MKIYINIVSLAAAAGLTLTFAGTANATHAPSLFEMNSGSPQIITIADDKHMHKEGENPHHGETGHVHKDGDETAQHAHVHHEGEAPHHRLFHRPCEHAPVRHDGALHPQE